ncbi:hypothetical protein CB1_000150002 [Camelus ferus]|nr:hypothetical protein CB1_000150002 [Camelus ferus]
MLSGLDCCCLEETIQGPRALAPARPSPAHHQTLAYQRKFFGYFLSLAEFPAEDSHCYWMLHNSNPHRCMLYMKEAEAALPTSASVTLTPSLSPPTPTWAGGAFMSDNFSVEHLVMGNCNPSDMPGGPENCLTSLTCPVALRAASPA